jgi:hypothetical protein
MNTRLAMSLLNGSPIIGVLINDVQGRLERWDHHCHTED